MSTTLTAVSGNENKEIHVDEEGFLENSRVWDENVARILAHSQGIDNLDGERMEIVNFLRKYYAKHNSFPILGNVCRQVGSRSKDCVTREFTDPMKAWKIAGLPKPPNIFFTTFDGKKYTPNPFY